MFFVKMRSFKFLKTNWNKFLNYLSYLLKLEKVFGNPYIKVLEPTNACMMNCIMCPRKNMTRKVEFMDLELYKSIIDQAKWNDHLDFSHFGDPLMHPQIESMIRYATKKGIKVQIYTNPNLLTEETCLKLIKSKLQLIYITIDGADDKTYKYFRGPNASYKKAIKNIDTLIRLKKERNSDMKIVVAMIVMEKNKNQIDDFKKIWGKKGIDIVTTKNFITFEGSDKKIFKLGVKGLYKEKFGIGSGDCADPWTGVVVTAGGNVVPCCLDYDEKYMLGDLKKESLKEIWNNKKIRLLRKYFKNHTEDKIDLCRTCHSRHELNLFNIIKLKFRDLKEGLL